MAKRKPKSEEQEKVPATAPQRQRTGRNVNAWLDEDLMDAFEHYLDSLEIRPTVTRAIELALKEFLQKRDFWPPRRDD